MDVVMYSKCEQQKLHMWSISMSTKITSAAHTRPVTPTGVTEQTYSDKTGLDRLLFFSDAVFAIAITLLALEIRLPATTGQLSNDELLAALGAMSPRFIAYGISFLAIGLYWMDTTGPFARWYAMMGGS